LLKENNGLFKGMYEIDQYAERVDEQPEPEPEMNYHQMVLKDCHAELKEEKKTNDRD